MNDEGYVYTHDEVMYINTLAASAVKAAEENLSKRVEEQQDWMLDHGNNLAGYVKHYGSIDNDEYYGEGGEAIFFADFEELLLREAALEAFKKEHVL